MASFLGKSLYFATCRSCVPTRSSRVIVEMSLRAPCTGRYGYELPYGDEALFPIGPKLEQEKNSRIDLTAKTYRSFVEREVALAVHDDVPAVVESATNPLEKSLLRGVRTP